MDAATIDLIFKIGTPVALVLLAALNSRYVPRKEFEALRVMIEEVKTNNLLLAEQLKNKAYIDTKLTDHENRIRSLEMRKGSCAPAKASNN